jgi:hypothetical protein
MRVVLVDLLERLTGEGVNLELTDSEGTRWKFVMEGGEDNAVSISLEEVPTWLVHIEGHFIGMAANEDAGEAVRTVFQNAGLTSLPEAVEARAIGEDGSTSMVFTLEGKAYCVPLKQFANEVVKTSNWITARQARRPEIDALMEEIKRLPKG